MTVLMRGAADQTRFANSPNYTPTATMTVPTYDGSGETTEPAYRYFPAGKFGHKHWLSHNPLPSGSAAFENPSLICSDDRVTWAAPAGLTNPIEPTPGTGNNADAHVFFDPKTTTVYMLWNLTGAGSSVDGVYYKTSTDCVTWGTKQTAFVISGGGDGNACLEPQLVYDAPRDRYALYTQTANGIQVQFSTVPTGPWARPTSANNCTLTPSVTLWHMDIITLPDGRFLMAFCDNADQNNRKGYLATSSDGVNWRVAPRTFLAANSWATKGPYRPSLQPAVSGSGYDLITARQQGAPTAVLGMTTNIPASEIP